MPRSIAKANSIAIVVGCLITSACKTPDPIPTYPPSSAAESFAIMRERAAVVNNISGEGEITLVDPAGNSVRFDAAFALAPPDRARIRAWKFGQAVLDLTLNADGVWLYLPKQDEHSEQLRTALTGASQAVRQWLALLSGPPNTQAGNVKTTTAEFTVEQTLDDGSAITCKIDRATLTPRQYLIRDSHGNEQFELLLEHYRQLSSTVWPWLVNANSKSGKITIETRDVELNTAPPNAFNPPARAERLR